MPRRQQAAAAEADAAAAAVPAMDWEAYFEERRRRAEEMRRRAEEMRRRAEDHQLDANEDPMAQLNLWLALFRFGQRGERHGGP